MSDNDNQFMRLLGELQRRRTFRVSAAYIVVAWVLIEVASVVLPAFGGADWILPTIIIVFVAGLPVAVVLSWIFDITPDGLQRTDDMDASQDHARDEDIPAEVKPSIAVPLGTAERRQVSILRCTFRLTANGNVVSDPEVIMAAMPELNSLVESAAERFSAYLLDASGPVFELLFGYPVAFENDAVRAVAGAFAIRKEAERLRFENVADSSLRATCSAAIHSDLVVIEDPDEDQDAATVVGHSTLVAGWLQTLAPADSIGVSESTRVLLRNAIRCESLGEFTNPQTGESTEVHQAIQLVSPKDALSGPSAGAVSMVGRESELALALNRWEDVIHGEDQFIVLRGEAGIGKSTMVKAIVDKVIKTDDALLMPLYCSPYETSNPFYPVIEYYFGPGLELANTDSDEHKVSRVKRMLQDLGLNLDEAAPLMAALLDFDSGKVDSGNAEATRAGLLKCLLELFHAAAKRGPICVIFEDIHWADPSTMELISMLVNREFKAGALCVFTARPALTLEWESHSNVTTLDLQRLPRRVTETLVRDLINNPAIGDELIENIVSETGGNPMFVEELSKAIAESMTDADFALAENLVLPGTVQQSLNARMDRLGEAKGVLQLCSLLGRRFDYRLLRSVSRTENEEALKLDLQRIVNAEFMYQEGAIPESVYRFKHVLMQETARNSLLNSTRIELHAHVAEVIEAEFPEYAERNPALLGYHYAEGGQPVKAVDYLTVACKRSLEVFAMREAVDQAQRGLDTLARLPQTKDRDATEILLLSMLGKGLLALHGYADARVEENFTRALELSESLEESPEIFQILVGLWMYFFIGGESDDALMVAQRLVKLADADNSPAKSLQAYYCAGYSRYRMAEYEAGRRDIEHALTFASEDGDFSVVSASGDDTRVHAHCVIAHVLWHLGKEDLAQQHLADSIAMAAEENNPWGSAYVSFIAAWHCMLRRDHVEAAEYAARTIAIAEEKSFRFWLLVGTFIRVWSSCEAGQSGSEEARAERLQKMEVTLESFLSSGAVFGSTSLGLQIAEDLASAGELDRAETWLNRVKSIVETTGERNYDADVPRIQGRIAAARGDTAKAVTLYEAAEKSATDKGSRALARRAASDKASLSDQLKTVQEVND